MPLWPDEKIAKMTDEAIAEGEKIHAERSARMEKLAIEFADLTAEHGPGIKRLEKVKKELRAVALEREESEHTTNDEAAATQFTYDTNHGFLTVSVLAPSKRTYWKTKELNGFLVAHPELQALRTVRYVTQVKLHLDESHEVSVDKREAER